MDDVRLAKRHVVLATSFAENVRALLVNDRLNDWKAVATFVVDDGDPEAIHTRMGDAIDFLKRLPSMLNSIAPGVVKDTAALSIEVGDNWLSAQIRIDRLGMDLSAIRRRLLTGRQFMKLINEQGIYVAQPKDKRRILELK